MSEVEHIVTDESPFVFRKLGYEVVSRPLADDDKQLEVAASEGRIRRPKLDSGKSLLDRALLRVGSALISAAHIHRDA